VGCVYLGTEGCHILYWWLVGVLLVVEAAGLLAVAVAGVVVTGWALLGLFSGILSVPGRSVYDIKSYMAVTVVQVCLDTGPSLLNNMDGGHSL
jgi:hypothetical protein